MLRAFNRMNDLVPSAHMEGVIDYRGHSLYGPGVSPVAVRRRIGMVFQKPNSLQKAALWDEVKNRLNASALDPIATGRIEDLMQEVKPQYTIVIVTHNMQQATRVSDRTAFFSVLTDSATDTRTGVLVEYSPTQQIFENPHDSRTEAYVTGRIG